MGERVPPSGVDPGAETRILPEPGAPAGTWSLAGEVDPQAETGPLPGSSSGAGPPLPARIGRYEVACELGRGGMGVVYRARDPQLKRDVALKLVLDPGRAGEDELRRFRREASAAARLKHPGIVAVYEAGEHEGRPFLVLELVEGESLEELLRRARPAWRRIAELARGVAQALAHAHAEGVVHRDVKPENVLVDAQGRPRLTDFGLARDVVASAALTVSGQVMGTPAYMAPEQARGEARAHGPGTDVYALGGLLYRALCGRPPFAAPSLEALLAQVLTQEPTPPRRLEPSIPPDLETIALRCLEKEPACRYGTAAAVAEDLGRWLEGGPILARPVGHAGRALRWARRDPVRAGLLAAVLVLLLGALVAVALLPGVLEARAQEAARRAEKDLLRRVRGELPAPEVPPGLAPAAEGPALPPAPPAPSPTPPQSAAPETAPPADPQPAPPGPPSTPQALPTAPVAPPATAPSPAQPEPAARPDPGQPDPVALGRAVLEGLSAGTDADALRALATRLQGDLRAEVGPIVLAAWRREGVAGAEVLAGRLATLAALEPDLAGGKVAPARALGRRGRRTAAVELTLGTDPAVRVQLIGLERRKGGWLLLDLRCDWPGEHARLAVEALRALLGSGTRPLPEGGLPPLEALRAQGVRVLAREGRTLRLPGYSLELRELPAGEYGVVATPADPADPTWLLGPLPGEHDARKAPYQVRERARRRSE